jgi:hypothetical protein
LTTQCLQQLPSIVRAEILRAQKARGEESIIVRSGFIRYLNDVHGDEFIALHFDQFHCASRTALCTSTGCLHKIFVARDGLAHREVWHDYVQEVEMTNETGQMSVGVECGREGRYCATMLRWNGRQLFTERPLETVSMVVEAVLGEREACLLPGCSQIIRSGTAR